MIEGLFFLIFGLAAPFFSLWLFSILFSPILACLLLWLIGDNPNRQMNETSD